MMVQATEQMVRECAYYLWIDSGRVDGLAHDHWIAAERTVAYKASALDVDLEKAGAAPKRKAASKSVKPVQKATKAGTGSTKTAKSDRASVLAGKVGARGAGKAAAKGKVQAYGATTH